MPLYDYRCRQCAHEFEALVRNGEAACCPGCAGGDLEQLISSFAVSSEQTRQSSLASARRANRKVQKDKLIAEREAIEHHDH
jgi:putative FmdB family regulatory protein